MNKNTVNLVIAAVLALWLGGCASAGHILSGMGNGLQSASSNANRPVRQYCTNYSGAEGYQTCRNQ